MNDAQTFYDSWSSTFDLEHRLLKLYSDYARFGECFVRLDDSERRAKRIANYAAGITELRDVTKDSRKGVSR